MLTGFPKFSIEPTEVSVGVVKTPEAQLPTYANPNDAGADLYAAIRLPQLLKAGEIKVIPTGLRMAIPQGYELQIRPRSGLAAKYGITVLNAPGTIDSDYRGEIGVILINLSQENFCIEPGDRIAQAVLAPVIKAEFFESPYLKKTIRDAGGFGSTGR